MKFIVFSLALLLLQNLAEARKSELLPDHGRNNGGARFYDGRSLLKRSRRYLNDKIKINFINKSGREVRIYQVAIFGIVIVKPQFDLRPNEPRALEVSAGSVWQVRDLETGFYMLTNGKKRFRIVASKGSAFIDLRIRRPFYLERKLKSFFPVPEKYLRVLLIADQSVTNYYGKRNGRKLLMTIMSTVSKIFQDKSLGIKLNIVLTKIIMIEKDPSSFRVVENDPDTSITNACAFASSLARVNGENNHDFAAIITRKSIGPSGYAAMYTMCTTKSCTLVKENGFNTAYVIAHEAGHALGIDHDGEDGECGDDKLRGSIMSPKVYSKHEKYHWSFCSKRSLYENIRYFRCLNQKPKEYENNLVDKFYDLPGEIFPKDSQCKVKLGRRARSCYVYYGACEFLWCRTTEWSSCTALALTSPLEGTSCGSKKWCLKGKCVVKNKAKAPVNGNWGTWTIFRECKGVCGAGIRTRTRECDNPPPQDGGRNCRGKKEEVQACKLQDCWFGFRKSIERDRKCKTFGAEWMELSKEIEEENLEKAKITCDFQNGPCGWGSHVSNRQKWLLADGPTKSSSTGPNSDNTYGRQGGFYAYFEASWIDRSFKPVEGTSSKFISKAVLVSVACFSFHYHMFGEHMGSLKLLKKTGDNELYSLWSREGPQGNEWFSDQITIESEESYQLVFEAVRGNGYRSDIAIDDLKITTGACRSQGSSAKNSPCTIKCHSPKNKKLKMVNAEDGFPCQANHLLNVCYQGKCLDVGCDYKINSFKRVDDCGICAGDGKSCKKVNTKKTVKAEQKFTDVYIIPEGAENIEIKMKRHPHLFPGIYIDDNNATNVFNTDGNKWPIGNYSFDENVFLYTQDDALSSIRISKLTNYGCRITVYNPFAKALFRSIPEIEVSITAKLPITRDYDEFEYSVRSWTNCTKTCDGGIQRSVLACSEKSSEKVLTDLYCNDIIGADAELTRACNLKPCKERYSWKLGSWGACSATCGISVKARRVKCHDRHVNRIVHDRKCQSPKPSGVTECFAGACPDHSFYTKRWSKCSKTCGHGIQLRRIGCSLANHTANEQALITCGGEFPVTARSCNNGPCNTFKWVARYLSACSVTCGGGIRIQTHSCRNMESGSLVFHSLCSNPKPPSIIKCNRFDCK